MTPEVARLALAQIAVPDVTGLLGYVEGVGLMLASLGSLSARIDTQPTVRRVVELTLDDTAPWRPTVCMLPMHLRAVARELLIGPVSEAARARVPHPWSSDHLRVADAQIGSLEGVLELAHQAGELMAVRRSDDLRVISVAIPMFEGIRKRLAERATPLPSVNLRALRSIPLPVRNEREAP